MNLSMVFVVAAIWDNSESLHCMCGSIELEMYLSMASFLLELKAG